MKDNDKQKNIENGQVSMSPGGVSAEQASSTAGAQVSTVSKIRAGLLGLTPAAIFKLTLCASIIVLAAGIIYHTATDSKHVNISPVHTATVVLSGTKDLGGIEAGGYKAVEWGVTNRSTKPAYVFIRIISTKRGQMRI